MSVLTIHGQAVETAFDLLGQKENAMTYSLGWVLAECAQLRNALGKKLGLSGSFSERVRLHLQEHRGGKGFTDLEIVDPGRYHIIIEAKRGFTVPGTPQLEKYADRLMANGDASARRLLVVLAESDRAEKWLPLHVPPEIKGITVKTVSWREFRYLAEKVSASGSHAEKRLLRQLITYLARVTNMQNVNSNRVYVVSLGNATASGVGTISNTDLVEKYKVYYHPVGGGKGGWPAEPPNYIAFRYGGVLKSIHHVEEYTVIDDFKGIVPGQPGCGKVQPHYLYKLGAAVKPTKIIPTNDPKGKYPKILRAARKWCFIDLLLTADSITEAVIKTRERVYSAGQSSSALDESESDGDDVV